MENNKNYSKMKINELFQNIRILLALLFFRVINLL
jgi:hypothetical protein